jgi:hypothetical protein
MSESADHRAMEHLMTDRNMSTEVLGFLRTDLLFLVKCLEGRLGEGRVSKPRRRPRRSSALLWPFPRCCRRLAVRCRACWVVDPARTPDRGSGGDRAGARDAAAAA